MAVHFDRTKLSIASKMKRNTAEPDRVNESHVITWGLQDSKRFLPRLSSS